MTGSRIQPAVLRGVLNFRDIGGLPAGGGRVTASGRVFRSDNLDHLDRDDVSALTEGLRVGLVIDLRAHVETGGPGRPAWASDAPVDVVNLPLLDDWDSYGELDDEGRRTLMARKYMSYLEAASANVVTALRLLAERPDDGGTIVHCAVGKDRTGVVIGILLGILGVRREAIVADYVATASNLPAILERLARNVLYRERMASNPAEVYRAEAHTMELFLDALDARWGGPEGWLLSAGGDTELVERLRSKLLADPAASEYGPKE